MSARAVRDCSEARKAAPAIIFVDEIDAIGQRRSGRRHRLQRRARADPQQMLAEMDGFDPAAGVVVLAATNRPEVLDPALLRPAFRPPGRDPAAQRCRAGREPAGALPRQDARTRRRPERRSRAARPGSRAPTWRTWSTKPRSSRSAKTAGITADDFADGARPHPPRPPRRHQRLLPDEKHAVAVHEAGHALVAALRQNADPVAKVTILPAGQTLGVTEQLPLDERHLYGEDYLRTPSRSASAAAPQSSSCSGRARPARPTTSPGDRLATKMVREYGLTAGSAPSATPAAAPCSFSGGGSGTAEQAVRRSDPGPHRRRGFQAGARGRAGRRRAHLLAPARAQAARRSPGRAGDRGRLSGVPDRRQAGARAPAR